MAQIKISSLTTGTPKGTDETPAVDTTDTTQAATGTTKKYIRSAELNFYLAAQGLTTYAAVLVATTGVLTATYANGAAGVGATLTNSGAQIALTIDGVLQVLGNRVLVKNQASTLQNGIYTVTTIGTGATNWVLTRATDFDQPAEVVQYGVVLSDSGSTNAGLLWQETGAGPFTIGVTAIVFAAFSVQSGAVNTGTINDLAYYATTGQTVSGLATANDGLLVTSNTGVPSILGGPGTTGQILQSNAALAPSFSTASYPSTTTANDILYSSATNVVGQIATVVGGVLITNNSSVPSLLANPTATGRFLQSVSGAASIWSTAAFPTTVGSAGTILRSNGTDWLASTSTFADTYAISTLLYASSSNVVAGLATTNKAVLGTSATGVPQWLALTDGQLVIGSTAGAPAAASLTAGTGVSITNASNSITISVTGGGLAIATISGTTQAAAVNTTYIALNSGQTTLTLPAVYAVGEIVALVGATANTGGWVVQTATGDTVRVNNATTSAGGTVTCTAVAGQCIELICDVANSSWIMTSTSSVLLTTA